MSARPPRSPWRFGKPDLAREVRDELAAHLAMREEELARRGLAPADAKEMARQKFGDIDAVAAACREIDEQSYREERRASRWMDLRQDCAHALRLLIKTPSFTVTSVLTLAIGIGATTAIFTIANWALLRPVPGVSNPERVRVVWAGQTTENGSFTASFVSYPNYLDVLTQLRTLDGLAGYQRGSVVVSTERETGRQVTAEFVTPSYFEVLGVRPRLGRVFTAEEDRPDGGAHVAVISAALWASLFNRSDDVFRDAVYVNGVPFSIVGVAPPGFVGIEHTRSIGLWLPGSTYPRVRHQAIRYDDRTRGGFYMFLARLAPGATWERAQAELGALGSWLASQYPDVNQKHRQYGFHLMGAIGLPPMGARERLRNLLALLLGASGLVLLIACANVANLLTIRGIGRRGEVAVRKALGATRLRLVRQHLTEGAVLWLLGGAAGISLVWVVMRSIDAPHLVGIRAVDEPIPIDWRVVAFAGVVSLVIGLVFSVPPALRAARLEAADTLRVAAPGLRPRTATAGAVLTAIQLAASLTLLVSAVLLVGSIRHLVNVPLGFDPSGVTTFRIDPTTFGYTADRAYAYAREFERRLTKVPGVESVAMTQAPPFGGRFHTRVRRVGAGAADVLQTLSNEVASPAYFDLLGIALLRGRVFTDADMGGPGVAARSVVMLSDNVARRLFGTADPLGQLLEFPVRGREKKTYEVVGVVASSRFAELQGDMDLVVYEPVAMDGAFRFSVALMVRAPGRSDMPAQIRSIAASLDRALPVTMIQTLDDLLAVERADWTVLGKLMIGLAGVATLLAAVGLYGVVTFAVAQRRHEFGVRLALGATPAVIVTMVLRRTTRVMMTGLVAGLGGAIALVRTIDSRLVGVDRFDPALWGLAALLLLLVALAASLVPARRAGRADVTQTLRTL